MNLKASTDRNLTATSECRSEPLVRAKANYFDSSTNKNLSVTVVRIKNSLQNCLDQTTGFVSSSQGFCKVIFNTLRRNMKQQPEKRNEGEAITWFGLLSFSRFGGFFTRCCLHVQFCKVLQCSQGCIFQRKFFIWVSLLLGVSTCCCPFQMPLSLSSPDKTNIAKSWFSAGLVS